ncbi:MAG: 30S ribosomal protein S7 [DPANN group archaeon]|nr:30S ribosomal protein S7 [DPANN group archaeon]
MMEYKIFDKYESKAEITDPGIKNYINLEPKYSFYSQGKQAKKIFGKQKVHIVERLINNLMRSGTGGKLAGKLIRGRNGTGKKQKMAKVTEKAFETIERRTKKNPLQILIKAIENAAPREETTRVKYGGVVNLIAVDISPQRRVDFALRNIGKAVVMRSFDTKKSADQALVEELILASNNDTGSHAITKKIEIERIAASSR